MRLVTWNVNGIRSLIKEYGSIDTCFEKLQADIVCIQESRISSNDLSANLIPSNFDAFASTSSKNGGYAGVMTFFKQPILPSQSFCSLKEIIESDFIYKEDELKEKYTTDFIDEADLEGRVLLSVFDNVLLLNVYFPAGIDESNEERCIFRKNFYYLLLDIMKELQNANRCCFLVGDFNTALGIIDSAYLENCVETTGFVESFRSFSDWLELLLLPKDKNGCNLIDTFRYLYPNKRNAYTCFNTQLSAKINNFGSRIDYILCSNDYKDKIKECQILSDIKGSDHLPVIIDVDMTFEAQTKLTGLRARLGIQKKINSFFQSNSSSVQSISKKKKEEKKSDIDEDSWECELCTFINKKSNDYCEMCGTKRKKRVRKENAEIASFFGGSKKRAISSVPLCSGHHLPCIRHQVQKEGKNKGRYFYSCRLPIGFATDPNARCNFFQWDD